MHFQVLSLFPELFETFSKTGLFGKGVESGALSLEATQLRDFAINTQGQVDDTPYGGGSGMVLRIETADKAIASVKKSRPKTVVVSMTPRGKPMSQKLAREIASKHSSLCILCGRYEGMDERIAEQMVDYEVCMGDYITMGGESPAMVFMEAVARLVPEVLGNPKSLERESFEDGLLEHPQYTRPPEYNGAMVPEILSSGNHQAIQEWQSKRSYVDTYTRRPDLARSLPISVKRISIALVHSPVYNKEGKVITSSLTNLDISDIARSAKTYGVDQFYIVHPAKTLRRLAGKICDHWNEGYGAEYNPNRGEALQHIKLVPILDDAISDMESKFSALPHLVSTSAKPSPENTSYNKMRRLIAEDKTPLLIVFGTGWGLTEELMNRVQHNLQPIDGWTPYNHLSVRAAAAITLDRLLGKP